MSAKAASGLAGARRIVVKIGSALLVEEASGTLHRTWLNALADDVAALARRFGVADDPASACAPPSTGQEMDLHAVQ